MGMQRSSIYVETRGNILLNACCIVETVSATTVCPIVETASTTSKNILRLCLSESATSRSSRVRNVHGRGSR